MYVVAARVAEKKQHNLHGYEVEVELILPTKSFESQVTATDTIVVKGLKDCHNEVTLKLFFSNKKKCGGGDVNKIVFKKESAYVTFVDPTGNLLYIMNHILHTQNN